MRNFTFYEFAGVLVPGTITFYSLFFLFPDFGNRILHDNVSFGDFGLFLILSYGVGQLVQALGNFIEKVWWKVNGGIPCHWVRNKKGNIISRSQTDTLMNLISEKFNVKISEETSEDEWFFLTRQICVLLEKKNCTTRIDLFNGNYGLNRGLTASLALLSVLSFISNYLYISFLLFLGSLIALYRMNRFAKYYARELFLQFLVNK